MNDDDLIDTVATLWVNNGGDADGLDWVYNKLKEKIRNKMENDRVDR
jgi:hypothetical protein